MTDRKPCARCGRPIDGYAQRCVYCNWDQTQAYTPEVAQRKAAAMYVPPADHRFRNRMIGLVALVVVVLGAFFVGAAIHRSDPDAKAQNKQQQDATARPAGPRSSVTLVPTTDAAPAPVLDQPVTSAPPAAPGQQASDATALPSDQYAAVAAKAKVERAKQARANPPVDPRQVRGHAYDDRAQPQRIADRAHQAANPQAAATPPTRSDRNPNPNTNVPMASSAPARTEAFPEYKPLPSIHVDRDTEARLTLTVGADGHVKDIDVLDPIPGATSKVIEAVQNWRFRPATENGNPVSAKVNVTITLHPNG